MMQMTGGDGQQQAKATVAPIHYVCETARSFLRRHAHSLQVSIGTQPKRGSHYPIRDQWALQAGAIHALPVAATARPRWSWLELAGPGWPGWPCSPDVSHFSRHPVLYFHYPISPFCELITSAANVNRRPRSQPSAAYFRWSSLGLKPGAVANASLLRVPHSIVSSCFCWS